jgi:homoserine kinase type II
MGLFTHVDAAGMAAIAARFGLAPVTGFEGVEAGTVNSNYRLRCPAGTFFVRINEGKSEDDVAYEAELVAHLAAHGVATPAPRVADDGRPYARTDAGLVTIFPWLSDGVPLRTRALTAADAHAAGRALAALHAAGAGFPVRRASRYAFERIVERWRGLPAAPPGTDLAAAIADCGAEIERLERLAARRAALPHGVIHGDLFVDNTLRRPDGTLVLLDFEQASDGAYAYDLAVCLNAWCFGDAIAPARARALVAGYREGRELTADERELLFTEAGAAAMRFTVTRITDVELDPRATPLVKATKDYRRYHARLRAWRALGQAGFATLVGF